MPPQFSLQQLQKHRRYRKCGKVLPLAHTRCRSTRELIPSTRRSRDLLLQPPPTSTRTLYPSSAVKFSPFVRKGGSPMTSHTLQQRSGQFVLSLFAVLLLVVFTAAAQNKPDRAAPKFSTAVAFDTSSPVRDLAKAKKGIFVVGSA